MRCRVTDVKENFKGKFENLNCELCNEENESQLHIINCKEINKLHEDDDEMPKYEEILNVNVKHQKKIAQKFMKNMKIRKVLTNQWRNIWIQTKWLDLNLCLHYNCSLYSEMELYYYYYYDELYKSTFYISSIKTHIMIWKERQNVTFWYKVYIYET